MAERIEQAQPSADRSKELRRELGAWLKQGREASGLTQAELAERLGLRYYSFVSQVENGIGRIPQDLYAPWAEALGLDAKSFALTVLEHIEPGLHAMVTASKRGKSVDPVRPVRRKTRSGGRG